LSKEYDAIGFDLDHSLVKYNVREFIKFLIKIELEDLHLNCGYPKEIMDFNVDSDDI
jgi:hypothetical protein